MILLLEYNNRIGESGWVSVIGEREKKEKERKTKTGREFGESFFFFAIGRGTWGLSW